MLCIGVVSLRWHLLQKDMSSFLDLLCFLISLLYIAVVGITSLYLLCSTQQQQQPSLPNQQNSLHLGAKSYLERVAASMCHPNICIAIQWLV